MGLVIIVMEVLRSRSALLLMFFPGFLTLNVSIIKIIPKNVQQDEGRMFKLALCSLLICLIEKISHFVRLTLLMKLLGALCSTTNIFSTSSFLCIIFCLIRYWITHSLCLRAKCLLQFWSGFPSFEMYFARIVASQIAFFFLFINTQRWKTCTALSVGVCLNKNLLNHLARALYLHNVSTSSSCSFGFVYKHRCS